MAEPPGAASASWAASNKSIARLYSRPRRASGTWPPKVFQGDAPEFEIAVRVEIDLIQAVAGGGALTTQHRRKARRPVLSEGRKPRIERFERPGDREGLSRQH